MSFNFLSFRSWARAPATRPTTRVCRETFHRVQTTCHFPVPLFSSSFLAVLVGLKWFLKKIRKKTTYSRPGWSTWGVASKRCLVMFCSSSTKSKRALPHKFCERWNTKYYGVGCDPRRTAADACLISANLFSPVCWPRLWEKLWCIQIVGGWIPTSTATCLDELSGITPNWAYVVKARRRLMFRR